MAFDLLGNLLTTRAQIPLQDSGEQDLQCIFFLIPSSCREQTFIFCFLLEDLTYDIMLWKSAV